MTHDVESSRLVPSGISGFDVLTEQATARTEAQLANRAVILAQQTELADKIALGTATPDEEARFMSRMAYEVGQGFN